MLVLARKCGEAIVIPGLGIVITVLDKSRDRIRLGVDAPPHVDVHRHEVWQRIQQLQAQETHTESSTSSSRVSTTPQE